jgi:hypothetical protein
MIPVIEQDYQGPDFSGSRAYRRSTRAVLLDPSVTARAETVTMIWHYERPPQGVLTEAEAPALAKIWDNDSDAVFDTM